MLLGSAAQAQLLQYNLNNTGTNSGSVGAAGDITLGSAATFSANSGGVSAASGDYALLNTTSVSAGATTSSSITAMNGLSGLTISGWLNTSAWNANRRIMEYQFGWSGFTLTLAAGNQLSLRIADPDFATSTGTSYASGAWVFFAATWDGATGDISFYQGGVGSSAVLQSTVTGNELGTYDSGGANTNPLRVGNGFSGWDAGEAFNGSMDDLRVYGSVLDVAALESVRASAVTVPEPASVGLFSLGGVVLLLAIRRRQT
jgi:hypothetical protein